MNPEHDQTIPYNVIKALSHFTATDQTRPVLTRVNVKDGRAAAADGFILATAPVQTNGFSGQLDAKQILATAKGVKNPETVHLVTDAEQEPRAVVSSHYGLTFGPLTVTTDPYPDVDQVIPQLTEEHRSIYVSPALLQKLVNAAKAIDAQAIRLDIAPEPYAKPIRFSMKVYREQKEPTLSGALMPMHPGTS